MNLETKEYRFVILGLKSLLKETVEKLNSIDSEDDEYTYLSNDAMAIEAMISSFEADYFERFDKL